MSTDCISGAHAVLEALHTPGAVNRVYIAKDGKVRHRDEVVNAAKAGRVPVEFVPLAKLNDLARGGEHQGVAAVVSPRAYVELKACIAGLPRTAMVVLLDQVQHPKNFGMAARSAAAAGAAALIVPARGGALLDADALRASAGALLRIPVARCTNLAQAIRDLQEAGFWVYGLDGAGTVDLYTVKWPERVAIVLGNESEGIRPAVAKACDELVRIPIAPQAESLNVAVAAAVALFEINRARR